VKLVETSVAGKERGNSSREGGDRGNKRFQYLFKKLSDERGQRLKKRREVEQPRGRREDGVWPKKGEGAGRGKRT